MNKNSKPRPMKHEVRVAPQQFEIRSDNDGTTITGYFATYGTLSRDIGFREMLQQGCFDESLKDHPVACFRDHNPEMLLGKTQSGTLAVSSDSKGLKFSVKIPNVSYANDLVELIKRGDAFENSFAFAPLPDGEEWSQLPDGQILRKISRAVLFEGSILTGAPAAYPNTEVNLRNAPASFRSKLRVDDDYSEECDPDSPDYDPDADCDDDDENDREICSECGQPIPEDEEDEEDRQAHLDLLKRRLR